ncbi:MAG: hypothetical protein ACTSRS_18905 [Candidatus Helarchaeota archaeon]
MEKYKNLFGNLYVTKEQRLKTLKIIKNAICPSMETIPCVGWNNVLLVGMMGSGKTQLINFLIDIVKSAYPQEEINIQFTNSMQYNIDHIKDVFYNLLIADDSVELQDSYRGITKQSINLSHQFFNVRHIVEKRFYRKNGYVLTVWGVQMYKALQKRLRQAPLTIFTSVFNDKEENQFLRQTLGAPYFRFLLSKNKYVSLLNRYDYNRFFVLKALGSIHYGEFDLPHSQFEKKVITSKEKETAVDLKVIQMLDGKVERAKLYQILQFIFSRNKKQLKNVSDLESIYMRYLYNLGVNQFILGELFRRSRETVFRHVNSISKGARIQESGKQLTTKNLQDALLQHLETIKNSEDLQKIFCILGLNQKSDTQTPPDTQTPTAKTPTKNS